MELLKSKNTDWVAMPWSCPIHGELTVMQVYSSGGATEPNGGATVMTVRCKKCNTPLSRPYIVGIDPIQPIRK